MTAKQCKWVFDQRDAYNSGNLKPIVQKRITSHLDDCIFCKQMMNTNQRVSGLIEDIPMDPIQKRRLEIAIRKGHSIGSRRSASPIRRFWFPAVAIAGITAALVVALVIGFTESHPNGQRVQTSVARNDQPAIETENNRTLSQDLIEQIEGQFHTDAIRSEINILAGATVRLDRKSKVDLLVDTPKFTKLRLWEGRMVASIQKHQPGSKFIVVTPSAEVESHGTIFSVQVDNFGREIIRVAESSVEVRPIGTKTRYIVKQGEELVIGSTRVSTASSRELNYDLCLVDTANCAYQEQTPTQAPQSRSQTKKQSQSNAASAHSAIEAIKSHRFNEAELILANPVHTPINPKDKIDILNRLARAYRQAGKYEQAAHTYERLAKEFPNSDAAINGLVSLAQIQQDSLGNAQKSITHFNRYLNKRPNGVLAEAARAGKIRALYRLGRHQEVIGESDKYLNTHPNGVSFREIETKRAASIKKTSTNMQQP